MAYPIDFTVDYGDGSRNRGYAVLGIIWYVGKVILLIPHLFIMSFLLIVTFLAAWIGYWAILFTGRQPEGISNFITGAMKWNNRIYAWLASTVDDYPPFGFDDGAYAAQTAVTVDAGPRSRLLGASGIVAIKFVLALPHLIIFSVLSSAAVLAGWVGFVVVGFTGTLPKGLHDFFVAVLRWGSRTWGWVLSLTDEYPAFSME